MSINYHAILEAIDESAIVLDPAGFITYFNQASQKLNMEVALGRNWPAGLEPENKAAALAKISETITTKKTSRLEVCFQQKNQKKQWLQIKFQPLSESNQDVLLIISDATTKKESDLFIEAIANNVPGMLAYWNKDLVCDFANEEYLAWFGRTSAEMRGIHMKELLGSELFNKNKPFISAALKGENQQFERRIKKVNGVTGDTWAQYIAHQMDGETKGFFALVTDITKVKENELQMAQASKLATLGEMSSGMAHEINNPLTIITVSLLLLEEYAKSPEKFSSQIKVIENACLRISKIVNGLRKFSIDTTEKTYESYPLSHIVTESLVLIGGKSKRLATPVICNIETEAEIFCNSIEIEQVIINLISNSIDAVKELSEKWVKVEVLEDQMSIILRLTDSGKGISEENRNELFNPFFTTQPTGQGMGLGLSVAKGILDQHSATIVVLTNQPNTCFEIRFKKLLP